MNETSQVICQECGLEFKSLGTHVKTHGLTGDQYKEKYPGYSLLSEETLEKTLNSAQRMRDIKEENGYTHSEETKEKMRGERPSLQGVPKSEEHKAKLSAWRTGRTFGPRSEETKKKMREAWVRRKADKEKYAEYIELITEQANTPERKLIASQNAVKNIQARNTNGKSSDTSIELAMQEFMKDNNIIFETQHELKTRKGSFIFDFYLPEFNILLETDGEYWHTKTHEQYNRDLVKERLALELGFCFIRISDKDWRPELIFEDEAIIKENNLVIMEKRAQQLGLA